MALPAFDNFNRGDSVFTLGANWTAYTGTWGIFSNAAYSPDSFSLNAFAGWTADSFSGDHYAQAVAGTAFSTGKISPSVRVQVSGDGILYYTGDIVSVSDGVIIAGVGAVVSGDVMRLEVVGATVEFFVNGVSKGTGTTALTGGVAGLYAGLNTLTIDDWTGGNMGGPPGGVIYRSHTRLI